MTASSNTQHTPAPFPGSIGIIGSGTWATALAKLVLTNCPQIHWYIRKPQTVDRFKELGHNPGYLTDIQFPIDRIVFSSQINEVCSACNTLILVTPSPYLRSELDKITTPLTSKSIVSAVKGMVPGSNELVTDHLQRRFGTHLQNLLVIGGPCHAEEVALSRPSYLTVACPNVDRAAVFAQVLSGKNMHGITSTDVDGIEYAAVLKNVYAIAAGMATGAKTGDNFLAMLISNSIREMAAFVQAAAPAQRNICDSVYLGDLLVTAYSRFSRNHFFGAMIGQGYSVRAARLEMRQTAEGYYAAQCITALNQRLRVPMPILSAVHDVLYRNTPPEAALRRMAQYFD